VANAPGADNRPGSSARQQRTRRPSGAVSSGGATTRHLSIASGQRGWKRQPAGKRLGGGVVRKAIMAVECADEDGRRAPLAARLGAALPRLFGMEIGTR